MFICVVFVLRCLAPPSRCLLACSSLAHTRNIPALDDDAPDEQRLAWRPWREWLGLDVRRADTDPDANNASVTDAAGAGGADASSTADTDVRTWRVTLAAQCAESRLDCDVAGKIYYALDEEDTQLTNFFFYFILFYYLLFSFLLFSLIYYYLFFYFLLFIFFYLFYFIFFSFLFFYLFSFLFFYLLSFLLWVFSFIFFLFSFLFFSFYKDLLSFDECELGRKMVRDFTLHNPSDLPLEYALLLVGGDSAAVVVEDYESGAERVRGTLLGHASETLRLVFRPKAVGPFRARLVIQNELDSGLF